MKIEILQKAEALFFNKGFKYVQKDDLVHDFLEVLLRGMTK